MIRLSAWVPSTVARDWSTFQGFFQRMTNRLCFGQYRYGEPKARQRYFSRLEREVTAYRSSGNMEHLINIANYAWLESVAPENPKFHYDPCVDSVTRKEFGV